MANVANLDAFLYYLQNPRNSGGNFGVAGLILETTADNLTAKAGGGAVGATVINAQTARFTTVATSGDSVMLPSSVAGAELLIINHGTNPMQVFGSGTDTIDDVAFGTGVSQMQRSAVVYSCNSAGAWYTIGLANGFVGGLPTVSSANNLVATPAGTQATSLVLSTVISRVTTVATAGDAVELPLAAAGLQLTVSNAGTNSMNVFPSLGDAVNSGAANAAYAIAAGKTASFSSAGPNIWHALVSA